MLNGWYRSHTQEFIAQQLQIMNAMRAEQEARAKEAEEAVMLCFRMLVGFDTEFDESIMGES